MTSQKKCDCLDNVGICVCKPEEEHGLQSSPAKRLIDAQAGAVLPAVGEFAVQELARVRARLAKYEDAEGRPVVVVPEQAKEAIDWIEDFIARCNGDDRGSCDSVNVLRAAMESQARDIERWKGWAQANWNEFAEGMKAQPSGVDERAAFEAWYLGHFYMGDKQCGLEWLSTEPCGGYRHQHPAEQWIVWQARAALTASAPNHSEQVREGWQLVPCQPTDAMVQAVLDSGMYHTPATAWPILVEEYKAMLAAAPSAGSQGGDV